MNKVKINLLACCASVIMLATVGVAPASATPFDITGPTAFGVDTNPVSIINFNVGQTGLISTFGLRIGLGCGDFCEEDSGSYWDNLQVTLSHGANSAVVFGLGDDDAGRESELSATFQDGFALLTFNDVVPDGLTSGTFGPQDPFSVFLGTELSGGWSLSFLDTGFPNDGTVLMSSSIFGTIDEAFPQEVPEPAAAGLLGLGLAGLALVRRRRK